jgi:integrase
LCEAAKLEKVRVHDLRHSFGALAVGSGLGLFVLGRALGHSNPATTNRYAHLVDDPLRAGVELVGDAMRNVIDGTKKVVELDEEKGAS